MEAEGEGLLERFLAGSAESLRVLVAVAHPDDEVLGCGAVLAVARDVRVIHVTDGAPRNGADAAQHGFETPAAYAAARAGEARAALELAGISPEHLSCLGVADQDASLHLAEVARRLGPALNKADLVLTHAFEGGHSDHDAVAFAVRASAGLAVDPPVIVEMPFYHAAPQGWHRQRFLPHPGAGAERLLHLDAAQRDLKARMIAAHRSQGDTLRAFDLDTERFRVAPRYDFTARPHQGDLLYERHGWNLDWPLWVAQVQAAKADLAQGQGA